MSVGASVGANSMLTKILYSLCFSLAGKQLINLRMSAYVGSGKWGQQNITLLLFHWKFHLKCVCVWVCSSVCSDTEIIPHRNEKKNAQNILDLQLRVILSIRETLLAFSFFLFLSLPFVWSWLHPEDYFFLDFSHFQHNIFNFKIFRESFSSFSWTWEKKIRSLFFPLA